MATEDGATSQAEAAAPLVTGQIIIAADTPPLRDATAHVHLEDVSYADAAASVVAQTVIPDLCHEPSGGDTSVSFALYATGVAVDPRNDYAVRVWVDRDGDGREGPDDLHSDQSYRVLTGGFGDTVSITLGSPDPGRPAPAPDPATGR